MAIDRRRADSVTVERRAATKPKFCTDIFLTVRHSDKNVTFDCSTGLFKNVQTVYL